MSKNISVELLFENDPVKENQQYQNKQRFCNQLKIKTQLRIIIFERNRKGCKKNDEENKPVERFNGDISENKDKRQTNKPEYFESHQHSIDGNKYQAQDKNAFMFGIRLFNFGQQGLIFYTVADYKSKQSQEES